MTKTLLKPQDYFVIYFLFSGLIALISLKVPWILIPGIGVLLLFTSVDWKVKFLPMIVSLLLLISFLIRCVVSWLVKTPPTLIQTKFIVQTIKDNYLLLDHHGIKYYCSLSLLPDHQFYLHQKLLITGQALPLSKQSNYFEFNFQNYLHQKGVNQEVRPDRVISTNNGWLFKINLFYKRFFHSDFEQVFLLNNHQSSIELIQRTNQLGITYLLNFGGLPWFFLSWTLTKLIQKAKGKVHVKYKTGLVVDGLLLCFGFTLNFPFVLTRVALTSLVHNWLRIKKIKPNLISIWVIVYSCLIALDNSLIQSNVFLYYVMVIIYFRFTSSQSIWKQLLFNFVISNLTFGVVNSLIGYRFFYLNEVFCVLLAPLLGFLNILTWLTFWIPKIDIVYHFLNHLVTSELTCFAKINWFYATGHVKIYWYFLYFGFLKLFLTISTPKWCKGGLLITTLLCLVFIFSAKFLYFQPGIEILNVGNGQTVILKQKNHITLFDAGSGPGYSKSILKNYCQYWGIRRIDEIFISHYHEDHYNQIEALMTDKILIKKVIKRETALRFYQVKDVRINLFNLDSQSKNENNNSLVYLLNFHHKNFLIMNDLETEGEIKLLNDINFRACIQNKTIDYLLAGHHGSKTSSTLPWLTYLRPKLVFISGEKQGLRQFPNDETISKLEQLSIPYKVTGGKFNFFIKIKNTP